MTDADLKLYQADDMPTSLTAPAPSGGAIGATQITGSTIGEVFFTMASAASGGGSKVQYSKVFWFNDHATDDLSSAKVYIANALDTPAAGNNLMSGLSSSASDNTTKKLRWIGEDSAGDPAYEDTTMNGTTEVTGAAQFNANLAAVELRLVSGGALTTAAGDITIKKNGTTLGIIPAGYSSAICEVDIGLEAALDDTATTTNPGTAPGGITFSRPRTYAGGLAVANSGVLTAQSGQGVWVKWTELEERLSSPDLQIVFAIQGDA